jgi:hypothetical protein
VPRIDEVLPSVKPAGPTEQRRPTAEEFGGGTGLERLGQGVTQFAESVYKREEQEETTNLHVEMSKAHADWTNHIQERVQKEELDTQQVMTDYDEYMGKLGENIQTRGAQNYFQTTSAELRSHFLERSMAAQTELAGIKAKESYTQSLNFQTSTLLNDPSSFEMAKLMHDQNIDQLVENGGLPAKAAERLKVAGQTKLAEGAIRGWIGLDPDNTEKELKEGKWDQFISGDLKHQLFSEIRQTKAAQLIDQERQLKAQEKAVKAQQEVTQNKFLENMVSGKLTAKDVLKSNLDAFGSGSKEQFLKMLETSGNDKIKTDAGTFTSLFDRIHAGEDDPHKIRDENELNSFLGRGLTFEDLQKLRGEVQGRKTQDGEIESEMKKGVLNIARQKLVKANPMLGITDPDGEAQYQRYMNFFLNEFSAQKKQGKTATQLLDPDSPDFLGKQIDRFQKTPQEIIKGLTKIQQPRTEGANDQGQTPQPTAAPKPTKPPREPGESIKDWLKRTGG